MSSAKRQRAEAFKLGAAAFNQIYPEAPYCYVCPLCLRGWLPVALDLDALTLDHVPPKSQGGRTLVLTCRDCNSRAGHELDAHLDAAEDALDFMRGTMDAPRRFELNWERLNINVEAQRDAGGIRIFGLPRNNAPGAIDLWESGMDKVNGSPPAFSFNLSAKRRFRYQNARIGWLKSAYLVAFAALGYRYILKPALSKVREQVATPDRKVIDGFTVYLPKGRKTDRALLLADEPERSIMVVMGHHLIVLPTDDSPTDLYDRLAEHQQSPVFNGHPIGEFPWPRRLVLALDS
jgi:hypothetical protein